MLHDASSRLAQIVLRFFTKHYYSPDEKVNTFELVRSTYHTGAVSLPAKGCHSGTADQGDFRCIRAGSN
jgi:hypothetical protein